MVNLSFIDSACYQVFITNGQSSLIKSLDYLINFLINTDSELILTLLCVESNKL